MKKILSTYFIYLAVMQHPIPQCENAISPLHSITGSATISTNDCSQMLPVVVNQSFTSLWRNFGPLLRAELVKLVTNVGFEE